MSQLIPNLIIAGAPKCGSTSLYDYLADHPQVCAASEQETRYLIDPGYPIYNADYNYAQHGVEGYAKFFSHYQPEQHQILLDCTPDYLYQKTALDVISKLPSEPKVIFLLRKPSQRVYSLYKFAQNNIGALDENISFREFVAAVQNQTIQPEKKIIANALDHSYYAKHIGLWMDTLGEDRIIVVLFEDLVKTPVDTMKRLAAQIAIDSEFYDSYQFGQRNKTIKVKNRGLYNGVKSAKKALPDGLKSNPVYDLLKKWYYRAVVDERRGQISDDERAVLKELDQQFSGWNAQLEGLIKANLAAWN